MLFQVVLTSFPKFVQASLLDVSFSPITFKKIISAAKAGKQGAWKSLKERKLAPLLTAALPSPPPQLQGFLVQARKLAPSSENKMLEDQLLLPIYLDH